MRKLSLRLDDDGDPEEDDVKIPLMIRTDLFGDNPGKGTPIRGHLLLMGRKV